MQTGRCDGPPESARLLQCTHGGQQLHATVLCCRVLVDTEHSVVLATLNRLFFPLGFWPQCIQNNTNFLCEDVGILFFCFPSSQFRDHVSHTSDRGVCVCVCETSPDLILHTSKEL